MTTNPEPAHRTLLIEEAKIDIGLDTMGNTNAIFDLATDHFGSDDDTHYMIHSYATDPAFHEQCTSPRGLAFLELLEHLPLECTECD